MEGKQLTMDEFLGHVLPDDEDLDDPEAPVLLYETLSNYENVLTFHRRFDLPRPAKPRLLTDDEFRFRSKFLYEELAEFERAHRDDDLVEAFDALLDLAYVTIGTAIFMGLPWDDGFDEVHRANLTKERVYDANETKRGSAFDVKKPDDWQPPELAAVLRKHLDDVRLTEEKRDGR